LKSIVVRKLKARNRKAENRIQKAIGVAEMFVAKNDGAIKSGPGKSGAAP
jgi:hypothetical protein